MITFSNTYTASGDGDNNGDNSGPRDDDNGDNNGDNGDNGDNNGPNGPNGGKGGTGRNVEKVARTGDGTNIALWIILLAVCTGTLVTVIVWRRRSRSK